MSSTSSTDPIVNEIDRVTQEISLYFLLGFTSSGNTVIDDEVYTAQTTLEGFRQAMRSTIQESLNLNWFHRLNELNYLSDLTSKEHHELEAVMNNLTDLYYAKLPQRNLVGAVQEHIWSRLILPSVQRVQQLLGYTD